MAYFGKSLASKKIEVSDDSTTSDDPEILKRLERIETNYDKLANILTQLEQKFEMDDKLSAIFDEDAAEPLPNKPR